MKQHSGTVTWDADDARLLALQMKTMEGPLLPILHAFTERYGFITDEASYVRQGLGVALPRMRTEMAEHLAQGGEGLNPLALKAAQLACKPPAAVSGGH